MRDHRTNDNFRIDVVDPAAIAADMTLMRIIGRHLFGEAEVFRVLLHVRTDV